MKARLYDFPQDWGFIPQGLEQECKRALNAVAMRKVVTYKYAATSKGIEPVILVGNKRSPAMSALALYVGVDGVLDLLSAFGFGVTVRRERDLDKVTAF